VTAASEILGHGPIIDRLWSTLAADRLHHAYLFEGPAGVGKRLVALRLAQAANCEDPGPAPPCGRCRSCTSIAAGAHPDVLWLEPEPGRATPIIAIDQVREVIRQAGYHRYAGRRRFIIVDPAEALPPPSANALLKTLEEPPDGTGFILIASHAASLLPTILSRCQRVRFSALPVPELEVWLDGRGEAHAGARARLSMGCPGVALALSDQALEDRAELRDRVLRAAGSGDLGQIFALSVEICEGGRAEWRARAELLLEIVEDLLRDACVAASGADVSLLDDARLADRAAARLWPGGIERMQRAIHEARAALAVNATGKTALDAVLVRLSTELGRL
jgi:DNA polymerase III subunit delta'